MVWSGHIQTDNPAASIKAFTFELKRPNKTRFEIKTDDEETLRVFDGVAGWREHTSSTEGPTLRRYSPLELRSARDAQGIDGLLIDHETKGIKLALQGTDEVDRHRAYRLAATLPSGASRRVWVDAQTFLDLKYDRELRAAGGRTKTVSVFYRDYRTIDGVQLPMTIETRTEGGSGSQKLTIDDVTLNPSLSDAHFEKPNLPQRRKAHPDFRSASGAELKVPVGPKLGAGGPR